MQNLSFKIGNYNLSFAGKSDLSVSQKSANSTTQPQLSVLKTDVFQKKPLLKLKEEQKDALFLSVTDPLGINEVEKEFAKYFPTLYFRHQISQKDLPTVLDSEKKYANIIASRQIAYMQEVQIAEHFAEAIKETLDSEYGNDNYSVLGIGRSPAIITQILKLNGAKSEAIPFSYKTFYGMEATHPDFDWKNYLNQFGFDEKTLTDKSKTTIVTDFKFSGATLDTFKNLLNRIYPDNNAEFIDLIELTEKIPPETAKKYNLDERHHRIFKNSIEDCDNKFTLCPCKHFQDAEEYLTYNHKNYRWPLLSKILVLDYLNQKSN